MSKVGPQRTVWYAPSIGLSTLFRPLPKRGPRAALDVSYASRDKSVQLRFSARCALGIPEQTLLLVLLELAREQHADTPELAVVKGDSDEPIYQALWLTLHCQKQEKGKTICIRTTWYTLNQRVGALQGGQSNKQRKEQLQRLCEVVVWEDFSDTSSTHKTTLQSFLVSWVLGDDQQIHLVLNQRLAAALLGGQYVQISLRERFQLKTDVARAIHAFLSATMQPGLPLKINYSTLQERFWPEKHETPASTQRSQRKLVKDALAELANLEGWEVNIVLNVKSKDMAEVKRTKKKAAVRVSKKPRNVKSPAPQVTPTPGTCSERTEAQLAMGSNPFDISGMFSRGKPSA